MENMEKKKIRLINLKQCPNCGASPKHIKTLYSYGVYYVKCCKCKTCTDTYSRWIDSVDAWNKGTARGSNIE